jgi:hypothetical protein
MKELLPAEEGSKKKKTGDSGVSLPGGSVVK